MTAGDESAKRAAPTQAVVCPRCSARAEESVFCNACGALLLDRSGRLERATLTRRFSGWLLEYVLIFATVAVGCLIWLFFTARHSQTPAKSLLKLFVLRKSDGAPASAGKVWDRVGWRWALDWLLVPFLWAVWDEDRQALHDKIVGTVVVYAPHGLPTQESPGAEAVTRHNSGTKLPDAKGRNDEVA